MDSSNPASEDELLSLSSDNDFCPPSTAKRKSLSHTKRNRAKSSSTPLLSPTESRVEEGEMSDASSDEMQRSSLAVESESAEVTLSDDDEGIGGESRVNSNGESSSTSGGQVPPMTRGSYSLRRKRKINYKELECGPEAAENEDLGSSSKSKIKKETLDVFSLTLAKLRKYVSKPELIDAFTKCKIVFLDGVTPEKVEAVTRLFEVCGAQFEDIFSRVRYDPENNYAFFQNILSSSPALGRLDCRYQNLEDAEQFLKLLKKLTDSGKLQALNSLKLISVLGDEALRERHLKIVSELKISLRSLELGDALWEDVKVSTLETLLGNHKAHLETLIIQGGFRGDSDKERVVIPFPKMEALETLYICPSYSFQSEIKNPYSKKARVITLGYHKREEPYKVAIKFTEDLPKLKRLVLGNLIEIEDLLFSSVRKLTEFRCGSYWNVSIRFPSESSRKSLVESGVIEFQFPDALKDPSFPVKVARHFPALRKVWMFLPSVPVLRAFFKAFGANSSLEELYLKTQFDFPSTMESCLLPNMTDVLRRNPATETILETLKEYKHFEEYIKYHNIELPVELEDLMEGHSAGIGALKNLKVLHLEHIPRTLLIPNPEDERKWYDHNCKFMSSTFGYERYPLKRRCHKEILGLNLSEYVWKNIEIEREFTADFHEAGFVDMPSTYFIESQSDEDEDLFTPVQRPQKSGTQVKIMPSMLLPDIKAKAETF